MRILTKKNAVFWDVAQCKSCVNRRVGGTYRLHLQGRKVSERGTSMSRWLQIAAHKIYTAPHPRRRHSSYSPPWKPQILQILTRPYWFVIDFNRVHYFKFGHTAFIHNRRSGIYHTVKHIWRKNTSWWPYTAETCSESEKEEEEMNKLHCGQRYSLGRTWKRTIFSDVTPCSPMSKFIDIPEKHTASIFKVEE
jgi:hypothetical protein